MRVKCIRERPDEALAKAISVSPEFDRRRSFGIARGNVYLVFGIEMRRGVPWVQIELGPEEIIPAPLALFEIVDPTFPSGLEARMLNDDTLVIWPSAFFSPGFLERAYEGDDRARSALQMLRESLDEA
jgi:hypothetical protein